MKLHHAIRADAVTGLAVLLVAALGGACASKSYTVQVPPRLDLHHLGRVGLVQFTVEKAKGSLHELATERFAEEMLTAQSIEVLELRPEDVRVQMSGEKELGSAAAREIGLARNIPAVFAGHLIVSNVKPSGGSTGFNLAGLWNPYVEATVSVELNVRLLSTESGATLWRSSAAATEKVAQVGMSGGDVFFSAKNPNDAYGRLVDRLVGTLTQDMRPTWQTRRASKG